MHSSNLDNDLYKPDNYIHSPFSKIIEHKLKELKVYPNPTDNQLSIYLRLDEFHQIQVIDVTGRVVISKSQISGGVYNLDVRSLSPGIYTVLDKSKRQWARAKFKIVR